MKDLLKNFDLFCFDFDGLLVDSEGLHKRAYELSLEEYGFVEQVPFYEYCFAAHHPSGNRLKNLYRSVFSKLDDTLWAEVAKKKQGHYSDLLSQGPLSLLPHAQSFIETLLDNGKSLCVVTNTKTQNTFPFRKAFPILEQIPICITKDDVVRGKPSPDGYLKALAHHPHIPKSHAIAFDDALKGITAIISAQITPVLVCSHEHPQLELIKDPITHIESLKALLTLSPRD